MDLHLSANALATYQSCRLRFKFRHLDGLRWPQLSVRSPEERRRLERGNHFHLMARRYYLGLDPGTIADPVEQRELDGWLLLLKSFQPCLPGPEYFPELRLRLGRSDLRLVATFDLLVVQPDGTATIFDWKTEQRPPRREFVLASPQTTVYRYMLCMAGGAYSPAGRFEPEQVDMVYWNPLHPSRWERLPYTEEAFRQDEAHLQHCMAEILATPADGFAPTGVDQGTCPRCEYQAICHLRVAEPILDDEEAPEPEPDEPAWDDLPPLP